MKLVFHTAGVSFAPSGKGSCLDPYFTKVAPARGVRFSLIRIKSREGCHVFAGQSPTGGLLDLEYSQASAWPLEAVLQFIGRDFFVRIDKDSFSSEVTEKFSQQVR